MGVVDHSNMSLAANAITYPANENSFDRCLGDKTKRLLLSSRHMILKQPILKMIEDFPEKRIKNMVDRYNFFNRGSTEQLINEQMIEYLIQRKKVIRSQLKIYIETHLT